MVDMQISQKEKQNQKGLELTQSKYQLRSQES